MAIRKGDSLGLGAQCIVKLSKYESLKPWASLTRTLGEDPEADAEDMRRTLYVELRRAVLREIHDRIEMEEFLDEGRLTFLIQHCEKVIEEGPDGEEAHQGNEFPGEDGNLKPRKKKACKKSRARRRSTE